MITNDELNMLSISPTNKDYYQIWSELLEVAKKLSERWDPASTNESDPGIVLLKALTAIADKLNYNIDKNILEAFMPTAAQEESMRRLCGMLGYQVKYYQSATTDITLRYVGNTEKFSDNEENSERLPENDPQYGTGLVIPMFTAFTDADKTVSYLTTKEVRLTNDETLVTIPCIEGKLVKCEVNNNSVITTANMDSDYRFFLPETHIAENGLYIYNTIKGNRSVSWNKVARLSSIPNDTRAYVFGFDSRENRPYVQFPSDVASLIEDGLEIYYIRSSGAAGNVGSRVLTLFEKPTFGAWTKYADSEKFIATNLSATFNGKNPETIEQAYNSFKKTVGTFDTLVTCRDYMNKIYSLFDDQNKELVSNIVVSDIRDDINRAYTLCSFSDYGIIYKECAIEGDNDWKTDTPPTMDHFDLLFYPFKTYQNLNTKSDFNRSFTYSDEKMPLINELIKDTKTIAHNFCSPHSEEIACIKNYLRLNARISTVYKVNQTEAKIIIENIKRALFENFNMRKLDFGEEIPYDAILQCIEQADAKIKDVVLEEPSVYTRFALVNGQEYDALATGSAGDFGKKAYNKLTLRNILAGRVELFKYNTDFAVEIGEGRSDSQFIYPAKDKVINAIETSCKIPTDTDNKYTLRANEVVKFRAPNLKTLTPYTAYVNYYLHLNNTIDKAAIPARFISINNLWTKHLLHTMKSAADGTASNYGTIQYFGEALTEHILKDVVGTENENLFCTTFTWEKFNEQFKDKPDELKDLINRSAVLYYDGVDLLRRHAVFAYKSDIGKVKISTDDGGEIEIEEGLKRGEYYWNNSSHQLSNIIVIELKNDNVVLKALGKWLAKILKEKIFFENSGCTLTSSNAFLDKEINKEGEEGALTLYRSLGTKTTYEQGEFVDELYIKYKPATQKEPTLASAWNYYIPTIQYQYKQNQDDQNAYNYELTLTNTNISKFTQFTISKPEAEEEEEVYFWKLLENGSSPVLGQNKQLAHIQPLEEYKLRKGEYLLINYTPASITATSEQAVTPQVAPINVYHGEGTIIKPNEAMTLYDSQAYYNSGYHSWAKTTGFDFSPYGLTIEGMYSIKPTEQLDIRAFIEVELDGANTYLYWTLNYDRTLTKDTPFTLEDGEYIFYTDKNKLDMAYYGSGTEIRLDTNSDTVSYSFKHNIAQVSLEEILASGIGVIPWRLARFSSDNKLVLREFQHITLTEGDSFEDLDIKDGSQLDNNWKKINPSGCKIYFGSDTTPQLLPRFNFDTDAAGTADKAYWEARSALDLDIGPNKSQVLHEGNELILYYDEIGNETENISITNSDQEVALKSNYSIKAAGGKITLDSTTTADNLELNSTALYLKVFKEKPLANVLLEPEVYENGSTTKITKFSDTPVAKSELNLYNFNSLWTVITASDFLEATNQFTRTTDTSYSAIQVHTAIPDDNYGLMMIYCSTDINGLESQDESIGFRFYFTEADGTETLDDGTKIKIFNNFGSKNYEDIFKNWLESNQTVPFDVYFDELSWWEKQDVFPEVSEDEDEASKKAFGDKELVSTQALSDPGSANGKAQLSSVYFLRPGLNLIVFKNSGKFEFFPDTRNNSSLFLSPIDVVEPQSRGPQAGGLGLNLQTIAYQNTSEVLQGFYNPDREFLNNKAALQLLFDLATRDKDHSFYYSCPIQAATALNINNALLNIDETETLLNSKFWYDTNNINNKFVISQIDADYLDTGLHIARASKL